jgi:hypothetical protein
MVLKVACYLIHLCPDGNASFFIPVKGYKKDIMNSGKQLQN